MGQAARTADTAADTSHALDKVCVKPVLALFEQCGTASFNSVTGTRFKLKILYVLLLESLCNGIRKTAASCKYPSEVGSVVKHTLAERHNVDILAVKECLKLLKSHRNINIGCNGLPLNLRLFRRAWTDKYDLAVRFTLFDIL